MKLRLSSRKSNSLAPLLFGCFLSASASSTLAGGQELLADLVNYPGFETLRAALATTSVQDLLEQRKDSTLLAPSNDAFDKLAAELGCGSREELLSELNSLGLLEEVVRDHIAAGSYSAQDLLMSGEVELNSGRRATVNVGNAGVTVRGTFNPLLQTAPAITTELTAQNGSALVIDGLVLNVDPAGLCGFNPNAAIDQTVIVDGNRQVIIGGADSTTVGLGRTQSVGGNETVSIGASRDQSVGGNEAVSIGTNRIENVGGNDSLFVGVHRNQNVGSDDILSVGSSLVRNVGADEELSIGASRNQSVGGNESIDVSGFRALIVGKDQVEQVGQSRSQAIGTNDSLNVGKNLIIEAGDSITIKTGQASIVMKKDGSIVIEGKDIAVQGSGGIDIKASGDLVLKGSKILQN